MNAAIDPRRVGKTLARVRVAVYAAIVGVVLFGLWRYDFVRLPSGGCSPVRGFEPGDRLVLDRHPGRVEVGDVVLFATPANEVLIGRIASPPPSAPESVWEACRAGALWIVGERPECPQHDSTRHGPIAAAAVKGRVAGALPW